MVKKEESLSFEESEDNESYEEDSFVTKNESEESDSDYSQHKVKKEDFLVKDQ